MNETKNNHKVGVYQLIAALFYAIVIIVSSYVMGGTSYEQDALTLTFILIALYFTTAELIKRKCQK